MGETEASRLIRLGEGQRVEFKTSFAEQNQAIESLCAFAHAEGGTVLFGVKDDGEICGVQLGKKTVEDFSQVLQTNTEPQLYPVVEQVQVEGKTLVVATIGKASRGEVFHAFGNAYVRVGRTNQRMSSPEQRARLTLESANTAKLDVTVDVSRRSRPTIEHNVVLRVAADPSGIVADGFGRVIEALWDEEARLSSDGSVTPVYVALWQNHDIYLRWSGRGMTERVCTFPDNAVMVVATDTYRNGEECAFLAATQSDAEQEYRLYPNHSYVLTLEIGAKNAERVRKSIRLTVRASHLEAGLLGQQRLEVAELEGDSDSPIEKIP